MSKQATEHHLKAAEHHEHAARHHRGAAKHHKAGRHEMAKEYTRLATGHGKSALFHAAEAEDIEQNKKASLAHA